MVRAHDFENIYRVIQLHSFEGTVIRLLMNTMQLSCLEFKKDHLVS